MNILLTIGTHGDERIGISVAKEVQKLTLLHGTIDVLIANQLAFKRTTRFIDQDLNRSFPGKKNGNHEQRLAAKLLPVIKSYDIVIDIHSTKSELKDAMIVTKLDKKTREYLRAVGPKYVLWMRATGDGALISNAKVGLAFEYGKDKDPSILKKIVGDIRRLLVYLEMIPTKKGGHRRVRDPVFFHVHTQVPKPKNARLEKNIRNYKLVPRGHTYARVIKTPLRAARDFYPILFGQDNYESIFGFAARKID